MLEQIRHILEEERLIESGKLVLCAVSGGMDSMVLLYLLHRLRSRIGFGLEAATVDHAVRPFDDERATIGAFSERLGIPWTCLHLAPGLEQRGKERGASFEMQAREERYRALEQRRGEIDADCMAVAHTANDQAETILMNLLRGTGIHGLGGIRSIRDGRIVRPLLGMSRSAVSACAQRYQIPFVEDPTNRSDAHLRNRIRHEALTALSSIKPEAVTQIARSAGLIARERDGISELLDRILEEHGTWANNEMTLPVAQLGDGEVRRLLLHRIIQRLAPHPPESRHIEGLSELVESTHGTAHMSLPFGLRATREYNLLRIGVELVHSKDPSGSRKWRIPAEKTVTYGQWRLDVEFKEQVRNPVLQPHQAWLSVERLSESLTIRPPHEGERVRLLGMDGHRLVSDILTDAKVSQKQRKYWPMLEDADGTVIWVAGVRRTGYRTVEAGDAGWLFTIRSETTEE